MTTREAFVYCHYCHQIDRRERWVELAGLGNQCPHCKNSSHYSEWPSAETAELINIVRSLSGEEPHHLQVGCVFGCTALELLLEEVVSVIAYGNMLYEEVSMLVDALLDAHQGRSRLLQLYKKLAWAPFDVEATEMGHSDFSKKWEILSQARNKIVHGRRLEVPEVDLEGVCRTLTSGLEVIRLILNRHEKEAHPWAFDKVDS